MKTKILHTKLIIDSLENQIIAEYGVNSNDLDKIDISVDDIFNLEINGIKVNQQNILAKYNEREKKQNNQQAQPEYIKSGSTITIPADFDKKIKTIQKQKTDTEWQLKQYGSVSEFLPQKIKDLLEDQKNRPIYDQSEFLSGSSRNLSFDVKNISIRIFAICKSLNEKVVNISPYIITCNWNTTMEGGNFSLTIASPTASYDNPKTNAILTNRAHWQKNNTQTYIANNELNFQFTDSVNYSQDVDGQNRKTNRYKNFYFEKILQCNDIVFIRGERMLNEEIENTENIDILEYCEPKDLKGRVWDMIGLIDTITISQNNAAGVVTINVTGRDLMKILIEDNQLIYPELIKSDGTTDIEAFLPNKIINSQNMKQSQVYKRLLGEIMDITLQTKQTVNRLINYIFDVMANIQVTYKPETLKAFEEDQIFVSYNERQNISKRIGIWNLHEVFIDESVKNRYVQDSSIGTAGGNILSFIKKVCMPPLVEFYTDTYNDRFYWIVRQTPHDYKSYKENLNYEFQTITDKQVLNFDINMSGEDFYSLYKFDPKTYIFGDEDEAIYKFPAVFFKEIAEIYGIRSLEIPSDYMINDDQIANSEKQAINDLRYLIETYLYKPFTRKGSITLTGDRRFKKGMNCYFEATDEMFYITGVSNQYNISNSETSRVTVLNVERGMIIKHYDKYFNIVDFSGNPANNPITKKQQKEWKINTPIWEFFLQKKQFDPINLYNDLPLPNKK